MTPEMINDDLIKSLLFSDKRLNRDEGESKLKTLEKSSKDLNVVTFVGDLLQQLQNSIECTPWSVVHGSLLGIKCILSKYSPEDSLDAFGADTIESIRQMSLRHLSHDEVRVRSVAGHVMGVLCRLTKGEAYTATIDFLLGLLNEDLKRRGSSQEQEDFETSSNASFCSTLSSKEMLHQSAGWRHLETSIKCLQAMVQNCGDNFHGRISRALLELMFEVLGHENRFVRETGYIVLAELFVTKTRVAQNPVVAEISDRIAEFVAKGLADNWSQVRLASSRVARNFLANFDGASDHYDRLLPRICLNRYYIADGVRIFSQNIWKEVCGDRGKNIVEDHIEAVVRYYVQTTEANNHAVREAACHCIAELAVKVNEDKVRPFVGELIGALLECFKDDSWPVRDAACVSCGNLLLTFHEECRPHRDTLHQLFLANLQDPIASVRAGAAISLGKYAKVYGDELLADLTKEVKSGFEFVETQPEESENFIGLDKKPAVFGVVKNLHDPNHTDQIMYSCGSLAPKMGRGGNKDKLGGCSDCHFQRPSKPWERSDGFVYFLTELARYYPEAASALIPDMVKATTHKHYPQHVVFVETICKQLPTLTRLIKKRAFKTHLEDLFAIVFYALESDVALTSVAAEQCLVELSHFLGKGILKGRIEMWNPGKVEAYQRVVGLP